MGTWGPGNLQSDGALDEVASRSRSLITGLWGRLLDLRSAEADERAHDVLMVDLETLSALADAGVFSGWELPTVGEVDAAVAAWLEHWDSYIDQLSPRGDHKAERRAVLERTFASFRGRCEEAERQRA